MTRSNKTLIFYSHSSENKTIVNRLERFINSVFSNFFGSYNSSNLSHLGGDLWRKKIKENIEQAEVVIILLTPDSKSSAWVMYEAGACWMAADAGEKKVIPCLYGLEEIPSPLSENQGINLLTEEGLETLVATLEVYTKDTIDIDEKEVKRKVKSYLKKEGNEPYLSQHEPPLMIALKGVLHFYKLNGDIAGANKIINFLEQRNYISSDECDVLRDELTKSS